MTEIPSLKHLCLLIELDLRNYKLSILTNIYYEELCKINEIVTEKDIKTTISFLVAANDWNTERGIYVKNHLEKRITELGFYSSILNKNKQRQ